MADNHGFNELLEGIQEAIIKAQEHMEHQHLRQVEEYFDDDGEPIKVKMRLPHVSETGEITYQEVEVPKIALVPLNSLRMKRLLVKFAVQIGGLDKSGDKPNMLKVGIKQKMFGGGSKAEVEVEFEGSDPPEIVARINDQMDKLI